MQNTQLAPTAATFQQGRLTARPTFSTGQCSPGQRSLGIGSNRDGILYVPEGARSQQRLVVLLHGSGGNASGTVGLMRAQAARDGFILLVPDARQYTWDIVLGSYGPDVEFINTALQRIFAECPVDASRVAIAGFSDGASYALSLGLTNGDLFSSVIAFSPGFMQPGQERGKPRIFVSHGTHDTVLPIAGTRRMVENLQSAGYSVHFHEFDGGHEVPPGIVDEAVQWLGENGG